MELRGMGQADLAGAARISRQRINDYYQGKKTPGGDVAFALADAMRIEPRWLIRGEGVQEAGAEFIHDDDVRLPHYDLFAFETDQPPAPIEHVAIRRAWLTAVARTVTGLWIAEMPSDAMETVAPSGSMIICREPDGTLAERRVYAFLLNGRPIIRRVKLKADSLVLEADNRSIDPIELDGDSAEQLITIGRVVAAINLQAV